MPSSAFGACLSDEARGLCREVWLAPLDAAREAEVADVLLQGRQGLLQAGVEAGALAEVVPHLVPQPHPPPHPRGGNLRPHPPSPHATRRPPAAAMSGTTARPPPFRAPGGTRICGEAVRTQAVGGATWQLARQSSKPKVDRNAACLLPISSSSCPCRCTLPAPGSTRVSATCREACALPPLPRTSRKRT